MLPQRSGFQSSVQTDSSQRANDRRYRIDLWHLSVGIEQRHEKKPRKTTRKSPQCDLDGHENRPARTAVFVSQMPLAPGTCGHIARREPAQR